MQNELEKYVHVYNIKDKPDMDQLADLEILILGRKAKSKILDKVAITDNNAIMKEASTELFC